MLFCFTIYKYECRKIKLLSQLFVIGEKENREVIIYPEKIKELLISYEYRWLVAWKVLYRGQETIRLWNLMIKDYDIKVLIASIKL